MLVSVFMAIASTLPARPAEAAAAGKLKVFILAGQSNMEGQGKVRGEKGTLEAFVRDPAKASFARCIAHDDGRWIVRKDVWIWYNGRKGDLTVGFGSRGDRIGPEFGFGHVVGRALDEQVLIIKTAWGGKSLGKDFRPPSSGGEVGEYYTLMVKSIREVLGDIRKHFPAYDGRGYEIAGFGWHQGWNDGCNAGLVAEYEENLANFIRDVRKEFEVPKLPFVIANSGFGGWNNKNSRRVGTMEAQLAVAGRDEFKGSVFTVETRGFFRPPEVSPSRQGYHWNSNAETYFLIGDAMGRAMVALVTSRWTSGTTRAERTRHGTRTRPAARTDPTGPGTGAKATPEAAAAAAERRAGYLYRTAQKMERAGLHTQAKRLYKIIVHECPKSSYASRAAGKLR
jgi:alpha-galactosidase